LDVIDSIGFKKIPQKLWHVVQNADSCPFDNVFIIYRNMVCGSWTSLVWVC